MSAPRDISRLAVRVRGSAGRTRDDGWVETGERPLGARLREASLMVLGGTAVGAVLLVVPLIHAFGVIFALSMWGLAIRRARTKTVLVKAGGICPRCGEPGTYYVGFGAQRVRFPISTSCPRCSQALSLESLPSAPDAHASA